MMWTASMPLLARVLRAGGRVLIHAAGLSNDEHTNDDVFCYPGQIDGGSRAADDRIEPWGGLGKPMPPYTLIAKTVTNLKKAWP